MKMAQETEVLKGENADLLPVLADLQQFVQQQAQAGTAVHVVELGIWRRVLELGGKLLGQFFVAQGTGDMGPEVELPDGRKCRRLNELHSRRYVSIFGEFHLQRTVYGSREGQKIDFVPLDNRLQLPESDFSRVLQDWDQGLCVEQAFSQVSRTIERMLGLKQSVDSLERMNVHVSKDVAAFREQRQPPPAAEEGDLFVSSADGKGVVMRRAKGEAAPASHRTKGEKASRKEMAIVGAVYSVDRYVRTPDQVAAALFGDDRDEPKPQRPRPCHKQVIASLAWTGASGTHSGIDESYLWIGEELERRNRGAAKETVHLCDGQESLWDAREAYLHRKNTTDILDLLHVTPRLWQAAHVFHKEGSPAAEAFMRERLLRVLQGKGSLVIRGLREMGTKRHLSGNKKTTLRKLCAYLENNLDRMRYDEYLAKGYPIASGVIEGACRHLVKDRMERAGMHWTRAGAQAMLNVRSIFVNDDWEEYQDYQTKRETARLYPYLQVVEGANYQQAI